MALLGIPSTVFFGRELSLWSPPSDVNPSSPRLISVYIFSATFHCLTLLLEGISTFIYSLDVPNLIPPGHILFIISRRRYSETAVAATLRETFMRVLIFSIYRAVSLG